MLNPPGDAPRLAAICTLTLLCSEGNVHPSDAGYATVLQAEKTKENRQQRADRTNREAWPEVEKLHVVVAHTVPFSDRSA